MILKLTKNKLKYNLHFTNFESLYNYLQNKLWADRKSYTNVQFYFDDGYKPIVRNIDMKAENPQFLPKD